MPDFTYIALGKDGHKEESTISAPNASAAGHLLKEQGLLPTEINEKFSNKSLFSFLGNFRTIPLAEKITFIENLSIMMKAGIAVARSLQILAKQTRNKRFQTVLNDIYSQVESGKGLGEALGKYPNVFSNIFISMIKVGELAGNLDKSLEYLGIQLQREASLKSKTRGAMIYPSVIVGAIVIIGILMSIYVLPSLTATFKDQGVALPLSTRVVIAIADVMGTHGLLVVGGMIVFLVGMIAGLKTSDGQRALDWFLLHMYIINKIVQKINLARFARILSSLLKSGIPIVESLEVAGQSLGNSYYRDIVIQTSTNVKVGKPLSESLNANANLFPPLVIQMLQVGEESGTVETILEQLAVHFEEDVDNTLANLSSIIEPLLLLGIGGVVGVLAVALISPIYSMQGGG
jgi:type II secretory pathway component PulF